MQVPLKPMAAVRSISAIVRSTSPKGSAASGYSRFGSALQKSRTQSLYARHTLATNSLSCTTYIPKCGSTVLRTMPESIPSSSMHFRRIAPSSEPG